MYGHISYIVIYVYEYLYVFTLYIFIHIHATNFLPGNLLNLNISLIIFDNTNKMFI